MKKERYERTEIEIFEFQTEDLIVTSGEIPTEGPDELPIRVNR